MKNIINKLFSFGKVPVFFVLAIIVGVLNAYHPTIYMVAGSVLFITFFKKPLNFMGAVIFLAIAAISPHFYIATDVTEYKDITLVKTGGARLHLEKNFSVISGDVIIGNFKRKETRPFSKPAYEVEKIYKVCRLPVVSWLLKLREEKSLHLFFASGGRVTLAQALIFGDRRFLSEKTKDEYTVSGLAHLLAMSGMHVGIITGIFMTALFFLPIKYRSLAALIGAAPIIIFGAFSVTVVRASLFAAVCLICYIADIKTDKKRFLLFMAALFVLFSPESLTDISFLLSFGAVFGIVFLMEAGAGFIKTAIVMGTTATLLTAPLSLYVFGTTNHLSILSTIIMSPVIYMHILFAMAAAALSDVFIAPLIIIEDFSAFLVSKIYSLTYFGFILKTIPLWALILCIIWTAGTVLSKYKWLSVLVLLIIFYPTPKPPEIIFPELTGSNKGFMVFQGGRKEIFYQGSLNAFKYSFLPLAAKYGIKTFDYGTVRIFGGENLYIKVKETGYEFTNICVNDRNNNCSVVYHTRSNSVRKKDLLDGVLHVIYKSTLKDNSIITLTEKGTVIIDKGSVIFSDDDKN